LFEARISPPGQEPARLYHAGGLERKSGEISAVLILLGFHILYVARISPPSQEEWIHERHEREDEVVDLIWLK
jgi:hypothetical protein